MLFLLVALAARFAWAQTPPEYLQRIEQDYRAWFALCDSDGDGVLTREEAIPCVRLAPFFDSMDFNRDGKVTTAEFERWLVEIPIYAR